MKVIPDIDAKDIKEIQNIADLAFGIGYFNVNSIIKENNKDVFIYFEKATEIKGFIYYSVLSKKRMQDIVMQHDILWTESEKDKYGLLKTVAVSQKYQHKGIGNRLLEYAVCHMHQNKIKHISTIVWKQSPNKTALEKILLKKNFTLQYEIQDFWKEDSIQHKYDCPVCGNPCSCSALIYMKSSS